MAAYTLTKEQFRRGMKVLEEHHQLFQDLKPELMLKVAKNNGLLTRLPKTKEGMALLMYGYKNFQRHPRLIEMVKEIRYDGKEIKLVMGHVDEHDVQKAASKIYTVPGGELYKVNQQLKKIY
jgi:hypothetical protein